MPHLKYYEEERKRFPIAYERKLTDSEAVLIFLKLKSHYHFCHELWFKGNSQRGKCGSWKIKISHNPSIGILVHEIAHAIQYKNWAKKGGRANKKWHCKAHTKIMTRVLQYVNNHYPAWLDKEKLKSAKRTEALMSKEKRKLIKAQEIKTPEYKLEKIRRSIGTWESKLKRAQSKLKKLRGQEKRLMRKFSQEAIK